MSMEVYLSCFNKKIKVKLFKGVSNYYLFKFWLYRFCPGINFIEKSTLYHFTIKCIQSSKHEYKLVNKTLYIFGNFENYESFMAKLITQVFQMLLIKERILILPAACVGKNNDCLLIIGDFGQGKTSTAIHLYEKNNLELITDNYVAIKNSKVIGSTMFLSIREENNKLLKDYKKVFTLNNRMFYERKNYLNIEKSIKGFVVPFINNGDNNFHVISKEESKWYLYQKFSRLINGETILFNGKMPSPVFNTKNTSIAILNIVNQVLENNMILYASSSLENIAKESYKFLNGDFYE